MPFALYLPFVFATTSHVCIRSCDSTRSSISCSPYFETGGPKAADGDISRAEPQTTRKRVGTEELARTRTAFPTVLWIFPAARLYTSIQLRQQYSRSLLFMSSPIVHFKFVIYPSKSFYLHLFNHTRIDPPSISAIPWIIWLLSYNTLIRTFFQARRSFFIIAKKNWIL
jgi:hypothetical protein